ncbi:MAG: peptidylprolyl isomerase [Leptospiraceae bacterium]|nr:peptidylprolyl isomerase [Leptospiraceae bacterium]
MVYKQAILVLFTIATCAPSGFKKSTYSPIEYSPPKVTVSKKETVNITLPEKKTIYAVIETSSGTMIVELFHKDAPATVQNFIDLAQGVKETKDPETGKLQKKPFYNGLKFHRVIPDFMIQGGDPKGDGTGGPGYNFPDEINGVALGLDKLKIASAPSYGRYLQMAVIYSMGIKSQEEFNTRKTEVEENFTFAKDNFSVLEILHRAGYRFNDVLNSHKAKKGSLAMANSGPNTNGSQFFINQVDTPHLDGLHTVFGQLVSGESVLNDIVSLGNSNTKIEKISIIDTLN